MAIKKNSGTRMIKAIFFGAITLAAALCAASPAFAAQPMSPKALILKPFVLTKLSDLSFGTILVTGFVGTVRIDADTGVRTMSNEAMRVPSDEGYRARFASSGLNNNLVLIKMVGPNNLVNANGNLLQVVKLELDQNDKQVRQISPTSQVFFVGVGGTVRVRANQEEGVYTGTFTLTATYL